MNKAKLFGILTVLSASCFIYSPVFAENPVDIEIIEVSNDGSGNYVPFQNITGAMPGETFSLIPRVINNGETDVLIDICVTKSGQNSLGEPIDIPKDTFIYTINSHWIPNGETDCYQYDSLLGINSITEPFLEEVTINSNIGNNYQNSTFNLTLNANAISDIPDDDSEEESPNVTPSSPNTGSNTFMSSVLPTASIMTAIFILGALIIIKKKAK